MDKRKRGFLAEDYASKLLTKNGYKIIDRNFNTRYSEIDIISIKDNALIFTEVKARWSIKYGMPEEAVGYKKLHRIKKAAELYCLKHKNLPKKLMIEVVSLVISNNKIISEKIISAF